MAKVFFQGKNDPAFTVGSKGSIRQAILLVLLLVTAVLGYLYFFTGLIKPREHIAIAPSPSIAPVKQPLPPRPNREALEQASTAAKEGEKGPNTGTEDKDISKPSPTGPKHITVAAAKNEAPQAQKAAAPPVTKPAVSPAIKSESISTTKTATSPAPKPALPPIKPQTGKAVKAGEKPIVKTEIKNQTATPSPATKPENKSETKPPRVSAAKDNKPQQAVTEGKYTLLIGVLASSGEAEKIRTKLLKQGITNINVRKLKKTETMHRIFIGEFDNQTAANTEFNRLKTQTDGAFVLRENARYIIYAGSYIHEDKAKEELKRLEGKGLKPALKSANVLITVNEVLAGSFTGSDEAQKEAVRLKQKGIGSKVIKTGQ